LAGVRLGLTGCGCVTAVLNTKSLVTWQSNFVCGSRWTFTWSRVTALKSGYPALSIGFLFPSRIFDIWWAGLTSDSRS